MFNRGYEFIKQRRLHVARVLFLFHCIPSFFFILAIPPHSAGGTVTSKSFVNTNWLICFMFIDVANANASVLSVGL